MPDPRQRRGAAFGGAEVLAITAAAVLGIKSMIPVANQVGCFLVAHRNEVSSTPTASTSSPGDYCATTAGAMHEHYGFDD